MNGPIVVILGFFVVAFVVLIINEIYLKIKRHFDDKEYFFNKCTKLSKYNWELDKKVDELNYVNRKLEDEIKLLKDKIKNYYRT